MAICSSPPWRSLKSIAEIRRGILDKPKGKKRERLDAWFAGAEGPQSLFKGRILPFDEKAALVWARLMSEGRAAGKPRSDLDMIVAAVAETNECVIVTDNEKHFSGIEVLKPLRTPRWLRCLLLALRNDFSFASSPLG
jgi:predicted nucleic acid-binding protein